jgi:hypothetical protein
LDSTIFRGPVENFVEKIGWRDDTPMTKAGPEIGPPEERR